MRSLPFLGVPGLSKVSQPTPGGGGGRYQGGFLFDFFYYDSVPSYSLLTTHTMGDVAM
jgi:hypothetical protein